MTASELRIGNNAFTRSKNIRTITADDIQLLAYYESRKYSKTAPLKPIPLTEEWLLKFGFRKTSEYDKNVFRLKNVVIIGCDIFYYEWTKIEYVHQLQNLYFALTKTELEIK